MDTTPIITLERLGSETLPKKSVADVEGGDGNKAKRLAIIGSGIVKKGEQARLETGLVGMF